jgi:hypothetical protein
MSARSKARRRLRRLARFLTLIADHNCKRKDICVVRDLARGQWRPKHVFAALVMM